MAIAHSRTGRVGLAAVAALVTAPVFASDYPTASRVDYVLACMASNGQTYIMMERCSCSIDAIAETIPFEDYERIETILRMREGQGELALLFRTSPVLEEQVQAFKEAQVEADLRCF